MFPGSGFVLCSLTDDFLCYLTKGTLKKNDGLNPQWGGGGFGPNPLFTYFFYFKCKKICLNIGKER